MANRNWIGTVLLAGALALAAGGCSNKKGNDQNKGVGGSGSAGTSAQQGSQANAGAGQQGQQPGMRGSQQQGMAAQQPGMQQPGMQQQGAQQPGARGMATTPVVQGVLVGFDMDNATFRIRTQNGQQATLMISPRAQILVNGRPTQLPNLQIGQPRLSPGSNVQARYVWMRGYPVATSLMIRTGAGVGQQRGQVQGQPRGQAQPGAAAPSGQAGAKGTSANDTQGK